MGHVSLVKGLGYACSEASWRECVTGISQKRTKVSSYGAVACTVRACSVRL